MSGKKRIPEQVARFREEYRREFLERRYTGWGHFAFTSGVSLAAIGFALSQLAGVRPVEWLMVTGAFLEANGVEYLGHKGPMHRPVGGLGPLFQRDTRQKQRYFTHEGLGYESSRVFI